MEPRGLTVPWNWADAANPALQRVGRVVGRGSERLGGGYSVGVQDKSCVTERSSRCWRLLAVRRMTLNTE
jgi:hypothetical protein